MSQSAGAVEARRGRIEAAPLDAGERGNAAAPAGGLGTSFLFDSLNGVERDGDVSETAVWLANAAAQGDPLAQTHLDSLDVSIVSPTTVLYTDADLGDSSASETAPLGGETPATAVVVQAVRGRKGGERRSRGGEGIENVLNRSYLILFPIQIDYNTLIGSQAFQSFQSFNF